MDEGLFGGCEPARAELGEEVARETAGEGARVVVHCDVEGPVCEGSVLDAVENVAFFFGLVGGDYAVAAEAVDGVPDYGFGVVGCVEAVVPIAVEGVRDVWRWREWMGRSLRKGSLVATLVLESLLEIQKVEPVPGKEVADQVDIRSLEYICQ